MPKVKFMAPPPMAIPLNNPGGLRRAALAQQALARGTSTAPVWNAAQGIGRVGNSIAGVIAAKRAEQERKDALAQLVAEQNQGYAALMNATQPSPVGDYGPVQPGTQPPLTRQQMLANIAQVAPTLPPNMQGQVYQQLLNARLNPGEGADRLEVVPDAAGRPAFIRVFDGNGRLKEVRSHPMAAPFGARDLSEAQYRADKTRRAAAGASRNVQRIIMPKAASKFAETVGAGLGKEFLGLRAAATSAVETTMLVNEARSALEAGMYAGSGAEAKIAIGKALLQIGIDYGQGDPIVNAETYIGTLVPAVANMARRFGTGAGITEADVRFASKGVGADIAGEPESLRRLLEINDKLSAHAVKVYNQRLDTMSDEAFRQFYATRDEMRITLPPPPKRGPDGREALPAIPQAAPIPGTEGGLMPSTAPDPVLPADANVVPSHRYQAIPPTGASGVLDGKPFDEDDIRETMRVHGISRDEVIKRLRDGGAVFR